MLKRIVRRYAARARQRRARLFRELLEPTAADRILDLGSEDGSHIAEVVPFRENVHIADISREALARGREKYGFQTVLLDEAGGLPFPDGHFDVVFCSSVIEHVSVDKRDVGRFRTQAEFAREAYARQRRLAEEIRRVSRGYFVQTPHRYFPIESHTWLPLPIVLLPRRVQVATIAFFNRWWPKKTTPDWHLLTPRLMRELFPDAEIHLEKSLGITKSIMAVRRRSPVGER